MADRRQQMLDAIEKSFINGPSKDKPSSFNPLDYLESGVNPQVEPITPDPERDANIQINNAIQRRKQVADQAPEKAVAGLPPGMTMEMARKTINPATGLPYSVGAQQNDEGSEQEKLKRQFMTDYFRQKSREGR